MKTTTLLMALLISISAIANEKTTSGTIPQGHKLEGVYQIMASTHEGHPCATYGLMMIGVKFKKIKADVVVDEAKGSFTATVKEKHIEKLERSYCKYQEYGMKAIFSDKDGAEVVVDLNSTEA